ncbi:MerR family transcriptional regulator [Pseudonocardia spinosispora]|uniref:MerR family transcriptional regulator n=1 Tax=Pseudonocardia spinosispora TaxID=103441 RepID=UPI00042845AE|nr:MerR family transcriptional regulator [Pseudonocardia spinosispora]
MSTRFTIGELAAKTGLTQHTLRYYENAGLLLDISRRSNGRRVYFTGDLERAILLTKLRSSGMSIAELRQFVEMSMSDGVDAATRRETLRNCRRQIAERIDRLREALEAVTELCDEDE